VGYEFYIILNVVDITSPSLQHNSLYSPYIFAPCHACYHYFSCRWTVSTCKRRTECGSL